MNSEKTRGDTLLEILITVVITSVALLGIAKLQISSLQSSSQAGLRSLATDLAASLAARMRANTVSDNNYISAVAANCTVPINVCAMLPDGIRGDVDDCSGTQVAIYDLWETRCSNGVKTILPQGTLAVSCTDSNLADADLCSHNSQFNIAIAWTTPQGTEDVVMSFNLGSAL